MQVNPITSLDAPLDEPAFEEPESESVRTASERAMADEDAQKQELPKPAETAPALSATDISKAVVDSLLTLGNATQQRQQGPSLLEQKKQDLIKQGIPAEAIDNFLDLHFAAAAELQNASAEENREAAVNQYRLGVHNMALEALHEVAAGVKLISGSRGVSEELVTAMANTIKANPKYSDIKGAIDSFQNPNKNRMKEVAAEVADAWCAEHGITKPPSGLNIKSSKLDNGETKSFDINNLSKAARVIYEAELKLHGDAKKARSRAVLVK